MCLFKISVQDFCWKKQQEFWDPFTLAVLTRLAPDWLDQIMWLLVMSLLSESIKGPAGSSSHSISLQTTQYNTSTAILELCWTSPFGYQLVCMWAVGRADSCSGKWVEKKSLFLQCYCFHDVFMNQTFILYFFDVFFLSFYLPI